MFFMYTGGEEKAIRTFEAPIVVLEGLSKLSGNVQAKELLHRLEGVESKEQSSSKSSVHSRSVLVRYITGLCVDLNAFHCLHLPFVVKPLYTLLTPCL